MSGSKDSTVRLWNAATEQQFQEHTEIHPSALSLSGRPTTPRKQETIMLANTRNNHAICFASSLELALYNPAELLESTSHHDLNSTPVLLKDGWMVGADRRLLFWVPPPSRQQPFYSPRTVFVIPSGQEIDLSRMAHGEHWSNCRDVATCT
ncbi:uncharacterized protein BJ212DRAFT_1358125 [Suillus subaureus]|uniref:Uncharacterized protein n=1 Tax=Suillus subaureus TaxID=48587 RepID=A0A9P7E9Z4_9AGAM|nr:uncharacterized protein BJ212DRAFT_1358125 [Suillus subaureus]KAG1815703.1 hypothetical protein BJ212DRAFT_1358125 [Suillus subaureus]